MNIPKCLNPSCNNNVKWKNSVVGFRKFCSKDCLAEYQHTDKLFADKISSTKLNSKFSLRSKYPNLDIRYDKENKNYLIIKNYCKHGDLRIYSNRFSRMYKDNKCLCIKCNEDLLENYIPSYEETQDFLNRFDIFYKDNSLAIKHSWLLSNYPKEYKIILEWSKHIENIKLSERIYLFKNRMKERPKCLNPKCNNDVHYNNSSLSYTKFCGSPSCLKNTSTQEIEIFNLLNKYTNDVKLKHFIGKEEFDICFNNRLLIEHNGLYWHGELIKEDKNYHYKRYELAKKNGYELFNIWGDDWEFKKDLVKSILLHKIGVIECCLDALECKIKIVDNVHNFLDQNHLFGWEESKINLGLFCRDELVSLMCFNEIREKEFELVRFCDKIFTNIIGSSDKLFSYFVDLYKPRKIIYYSQCDFKEDFIYCLGFREIRNIGIKNWWCDNKRRFSEEKECCYKIWDSGSLLLEIKF